jgi:hypothetical protein
MLMSFRSANTSPKSLLHPGWMLALSCCILGGGAAQAKPNLSPPGVALQELKPTIIQSVKNDISPALRTLKVNSPVSGDREIPNRKLVDFDEETLRKIKTIRPNTTQVADPVVQAAPSAPNIPTPILTFDGVNNRNGVLPPDTSLDVGPNNIVQWVNLSYSVFNKAGATLAGPFNGNALWAGFGGLCQTTNNGDVIVLYDPIANRWMFSQWAFTSSTTGPYRQCFAVSTTPDPTGTYYRYEFIVSNNKFNDYSKLSVWPGSYFMTSNQFLNGQSFAGAGIWAFERDKMLLGQPARLIYFDLEPANPNFGGVLPSDVDGAVPPAGTPGYFAEVDDSSFGFPTDQLALWEFKVDWTNPANSTFGLAGQPNLVFKPPTLAAFTPINCVTVGSRACIPQGGTFRRIDAIGDRLMYRLAYRNMGTYQSLVLNHSVNPGVSGSFAAPRWYELRNTGSGYSIFQQGTFAPDSTSRWMGSIASDGSGNIAMGYSASSSSIFPQIRYAGRLTTDALGTFGQGEATLFAGSGSQTSSSNRWGDYSTMAVDPVDNCTFYYSTEYYQSTSTSSWRTRIGSFKFPTCSGAPQVLTGPTTTSIGKTVTLTGANFDPNPGKTTVRFTTAGGEMDGRVIDITPTTINVVVPDAAITGPIRVITQNGRTEAPSSLSVSAQ